MCLSGGDGGDSSSVEAARSQQELPLSGCYTSGQMESNE